MLGMPVFVMKATLTRSEYMGWLSYLRYREPDTTEIQLATLSMQVSRGLGGKGNVTDFLVHKPDRNQNSEQKEMSMDAVKSVFQGFATPQKK